MKKLLENLSYSLDSARISLEDAERQLENIGKQADGLTSSMEKSVYDSRILFSEKYVSNSYIIELKKNIDSMENYKMVENKSIDDLMKKINNKKDELIEVKQQYILENNLAQKPFIHYFSGKYNPCKYYLLISEGMIMVKDFENNFLGIIMGLKYLKEHVYKQPIN